MFIPSIVQCKGSPQKQVKTLHQAVQTSGRA